MIYDPLYELVHSLTPAEKRYAGLFLARLQKEKKSHMMFIFQMLQDMESFDEKRFRSQSLSRMSSKTLSAEKNALYKNILMAMRVFHDQKSVDAQIRDLLNEAEFLFDKRLYSLSNERIGIAKILAEKYERRTAQLEILKLEADICKEKQEKKLDKFIFDNHFRQEEVLRSTIAEYRAKMRRDRALIGSRIRFFDEEIETISADDHFSIMSKAEDSFNYLYNTWAADALECVRQSRLEDAALYYDRLTDLWEKYPHRVQAESMQYQRMLSNAVNVFQMLGANEKVRTLIEKLDQLPCRNSEEEAEQFQISAFAWLLYLMNAHEWERVKEHIVSIEKGLDYYKSKINKARELAFRCNITVCWMMLDEWKKAMIWVNTIIDSPKTEVRKDIQQMVRILKLIFYYELNQFDLLEYELINAERYLRQRKMWYAYEAAVARMLKKLIAKDEAERIPVFTGFIDQLTKLGTDRNSPLPAASELKLWANAHIAGKSIREMLGTEKNNG